MHHSGPLKYCYQNVIIFFKLFIVKMCTLNILLYNNYSKSNKLLEAVILFIVNIVIAKEVELTLTLYSLSSSTILFKMEIK